MSSDEPLVIVSHSAGVASLTLNRPQVLNALNGALARALLAALTAVKEDSSVRAVIIRGAGDAFMAGGDIGYFRSLLDDHPDRAGIRPDVTRLIEQAQDVTRMIRNLPQPVIASVHGGCAGFGFSLMLACDLVVAADNAKFTLAYIHLATTPDGGASYHLPRIVGQKRAAEIALLGDRFGPAEAERWGLINRVAPLAELEAVTAKIATRMAAGPALAYARTKRLLNQSDDMSLDAQLRAETDAFADSALTDDFSAGVSAFLQKKPATFAGK
jgi:2-(1,2-epoxy-1,2-dihydrophenyl)acetyl-CoA isomerase